MIASSLLFSISLSLFLAALIQLVYKSKTFFNYVMSGMYFSLAYYMLYLWLYNASLLPSFIFGTDAAVSFFIGPLLCLYFLMISGSLEKKPQYVVPFVIQFVIVFIAIVIFNIFDPVSIHTNGHYHPYFQLSPMRDRINTVSDYYFFLCAYVLFFYLLKKGIPFKKRTNYNFLIFLLSCIFVLGSTLMALTHFYRSNILVTTSMVVYGIFGIVSILFTYRYPRETQLTLSAVNITKKKQDGPLPSWTDDAVKKLADLLEKDRIYSQPDVSLKQVAELMGSSPNQLSWLVNQYYGMNFRMLINTCRLEDARAVLVENQGMNILEVAFYTGFNSKSSFNTLFKQRYGLTPSEFRKNGEKKHSPSKPA